MAENENLTDAQLVAELAKFGEKVQLPIKHTKRPLLRKKLNHLRAKSDKQSGTYSTRRSLKSDPTFLEPRPKASVVGDRSFSYLNSTAGPSTLGTLSSDDSDLEEEEEEETGGAYTSSTSFKSNRRLDDFRYADLTEKPRPSSWSDGVRRPYRDYTEELPRHREQEHIDKKYMYFSSDSINNADNQHDMSKPSRLYPDLSKLTPIFTNDRRDRYESSDSDYDDIPGSHKDSRYETRAKVTPKGYERYSDTFMKTTPHKAPSSSYRNIADRQQKANWRRSAYRPSWLEQCGSLYFKSLPRILVGLAIAVAVLSVAYFVLYKCSIWPLNTSNMVLGDHLLLCRENNPDKRCFEKVLVDKTLKLLHKLFERLSIKKGEVLCDNARVGSDLFDLLDLKRYIKDNENWMNQEQLFECCLEHILANPHWKIRAMKEDGSPATSLREIAKIESEFPSMSFYCRLRRSVAAVIYEIIVVLAVIGSLLLLAFGIKYYLKKKEAMQKEVFLMVDQIIDILQEHSEQTKEEDSDEPPYLVVQHIRDQLLPPSKRHRLQPIWDKAVAFITANDSRVRSETRMIHGDEFEVWLWLQPNVPEGKIWQGQEFNESNSRRNSIQNPTPRLKICGMFDSDMENEDDLEDIIVSAIQERCKSVDSIVDIFVDVGSRDRCVYVKCSSCQAAGRARQALDGWWFNGKRVTVKDVRGYSTTDAGNPTRPLRTH